MCLYRYLPMKIAILTSGLLPVPATQGGAVEELTDHYVALNAVTREHAITIFTCQAQPTAKASATPATTYVSIPMHSLRARLRRKLRSITCRKRHSDMPDPPVYDYYVNDFYLACRRLLLRQSWDAIILENRPGFAIDLRKHTESRLILHHHLDNIGPDMPLSPEICRAADDVITASDYLAERVRSVAKTMPADLRPNITTVHNGIDVEAFDKALPATRADLGLLPSDFVIVYTGRIDPIKGIRELVQAMTLIHDRRRQASYERSRQTGRCRLLVVGGSFYGGDVGGNPEFIRDLRAQAEPLRDDIVFTGYVPHQRVASLLKLADLAVLPSTCQEAFALTVLEAMAAGVPVLTTRSGGVPETCEGIAHIIDQGTDLPQRLADEIMTLQAMPDERTRMSEEGKKRALHFTYQAYARAFLDAIAT